MLLQHLATTLIVVEIFTPVLQNLWGVKHDAPKFSQVLKCDLRRAMFDQ
jgi:hypothetical protein